MSMRVLMISTDKNVFEEKSEVRQRMIEYGRLVDELHVIVFTKQQSQISNLKSKNFGNVFLYPTNSQNRLFYIFDAVKISKKIKNIDLITTQDPFETGLAGWRLARKFSLPLQIQVHTDFLSPYFKKESFLNKLRVYLAKFLIKRASCVRVVSERIKKSLVANACLLARRGYTLYPIVVLPVFVDVEKIKNAPIKTDLRKKYSQFDFIILMASRFSKEKNISLAIDAMAEVVKHYPMAGLLIIGDGPQHEALKLQITNYKLQKNIVLENWTNDLSSYYKTADLFLLTSNYEGYGRTLIEAASVGCKIISSDVGVADEILPEENIFEPGNKEQLKEKIIKAIKGEIKMSNTQCLTKMPTKEQYLQAYKKSWENCEFVE